MSTWTDLGKRRAGLPPETELVDGVPPHLFGPLERWVIKRRIAGSDAYWDELQLRTGVFLAGRSGDNLLTVTDFILFWYPKMPPEARRNHAVDDPQNEKRWHAHVAELDQILALGRSVWCVNGRGDGLERRLEPAVTAAAREAVAAAPPAAQDHLLTAWAAAYGRSPDPDKVFHEVIRAIEDIACPLVEPSKAKSGRSTLGTVIGELRNNSFTKWELLLPGHDGQPRDITHLVGMLELIWHAQVSRHGGAPKSRRQDQTEAQTVVHLAATVAHWLSSGVLRRKANP